MKRPAGLIASIIVLALASLGQVGMALFWAFIANFEQHPRLSATHPGTTIPAIAAWMPAFTYGLCVFSLAMAAWGVATLIGLYRLRHWARISILIVGGGMAVFGAISAFAALLPMFIPLSARPNIDASHAHAALIAVRVVFAVVGLFFAAIVAIGIWWLAYFNRENVRAMFAGVDGQIEESRRPVLISVYAVLLILGIPTYFLMAIMPLPIPLLGLYLIGWGKDVLIATYVGLHGAAGFGLWQLKEWARRLALAILALGAVNTAVYLLWPGMTERYRTEFFRSMNLPQPPNLGHLRTVMQAASLTLGVALMIAIVFMLHHYRDRFREPAAPPPLAPLPPEPGTLQP